MSLTPASLEHLRWAYRLLLEREPDPGGFEHFARRIEDEGLTVRRLVGEFIDSGEFAKLHGRRDQPGQLVPSIPLGWQACSNAQLESNNFRYWTSLLRERQPRPHRKIWEWSYIAQALHERGCLAEGMRGLGFAVGTEPLAALFASRGCTVTATDLDFAAASEGGWTRTHEHAANIGVLNERGICDARQFEANVQFTHVDMREIPADLVGYDFLWSSCSIEHLGSIDEALDFVVSAMRCLRPGGLAVHTTEFNCESDTSTVEQGKDVILRKRDFLRLRERLESSGCDVGDIDFALGKSDADTYVDEAPYRGPAHLRLRIGGFVSTSFGMIIQKGLVP